MDSLSGLSVDDILVRPSSKIAIARSHQPLIGFISADNNITELATWALTEDKIHHPQYSFASEMAFELIMAFLSLKETESYAYESLKEMLLRTISEPTIISTIPQEKLLRIMTKILTNPENDLNWINEEHICSLLQAYESPSIFELICVYFQSIHSTRITGKLFFDSLLCLSKNGDNKYVAALLFARIILRLPYSSRFWKVIDIRSAIEVLTQRAEKIQYYVWCETIIFAVSKMLDRTGCSISTFYSYNPEFKLSLDNFNTRAIIFANLETELAIDIYTLLFLESHNSFLSNFILQKLDSLEDEDFERVLLSENFISMLIQSYYGNNWNSYLTNIVIGIDERGYSHLTKDLSVFIEDKFRAIIDISDREYGF